MPAGLEELKSQIVAEVDRHRQQLVDLSLRIHSHPEIALQEVQASQWLAESLEAAGFGVQRDAGGLPTAFKAIYGKGKPVIAFFAEYDALPGLGHACGHNIICTSALGAGIAAKLAVDALGGSVVVMGTPAEESVGGKVIMAECGVFSDLDVALLVHPGSQDRIGMEALAMVEVTVDFYGKAAHASARPHDGLNALDAMILSYNAINALRQHMKDSSRIHGIITKGGDAPNIVPDHTSARFYIRATSDSYLDELKERVVDCFRAGATATGTRLEYSWTGSRYAALHNNKVLAGVFASNMASLGREPTPQDPEEGLGSTDMGNVSALVPTLHPEIAVAPREVPIHSEAFVKYAAADAGHKALLDAAKAMALTAADILSQPELLKRIKEEFLRGDR